MGFLPSVNSVVDFELGFVKEMSVAYGTHVLPWVRGSGQRIQVRHELVERHDVIRRFRRGTSVWL